MSSNNRSAVPTPLSPSGIGTDRSSEWEWSEHFNQSMQEEIALEVAGLSLNLKSLGAKDGTLTAMRIYNKIFYPGFQEGSPLYQSAMVYNGSLPLERALLGLKIDDKNSFLIVPLVWHFQVPPLVFIPGHVFAMVIRRTQEGFSAVTVNMGLRGHEQQYVEYFFRDPNKLVQAYIILSSFSPLQPPYFVQGMYDVLRKYASESYDLAIHSQDQSVGNCSVKELEKALKLALSIGSDEIKSARLRPGEARPPEDCLHPKYKDPETGRVMSSEEVHERLINELILENPGRKIEDKLNSLLCRYRLAKAASPKRLALPHPEDSVGDVRMAMKSLIDLKPSDITMENLKELVGKLLRLTKTHPKVYLSIRPDFIKKILTAADLQPTDKGKFKMLRKAGILLHCGETWEKRGDMCKDRHWRLTAISRYKLSLWRISDGNIRAKINEKIGDCYCGEGKFKSAIRHYERASQRSPVVIPKLARCYYQVKNFSCAAQCCRSILNANPNDHAIRKLLADSCFELKIYALAVAEYEALPVEMRRNPDMIQKVSTCRREMVRDEYMLRVRSEFESRSQAAASLTCEIHPNPLRPASPAQDAGVCVFQIQPNPRSPARLEYQFRPNPLYKGPRAHLPPL